MYVCTSEIVKKANKIIDLCGTRDPHRIARELGVEILYYPFNRQRGAYKVIMRNRFMFIKDNLHPVMEKIVLLHELGHDSLHREEATQVGGFKEFNIFDMRDNRMEFEANVFASQIALPEYSCAATPQIRQTGNRLSGLAETVYASLLAQCFV